MEYRMMDNNLQEEQNGQSFERSSSMIEMKRIDDILDVQIEGRRTGRELRSKSNHDYSENSYTQHMMKNEQEESNEENSPDGLYDNVQPIVDMAQQVEENQELLFRIISNTDIAVLDATLKRISYSMDLTSVVNSENGYSLLHLAVFKDSDHIVYSLWKYVMERPTEPKEVKIIKLRNWINLKSQGKEGFTSLHLAAFNGNLSMIRFLERHGGDIYAENNFNLNMLHVASQGNQPSTIVYFIDKNIEVNWRDKVNSTPLHWACYAGAENAVSYLIANGADSNLQDNDGYTPLHLAVKSAEAIKSTRIVKQLLFCGADRNMINNEGYKPVDYIKSIALHHIAIDIRKSLAEPKYCSCLLLSQPLTKMKKEPYTAIYFLFLIILSYVLLLLFIFPVVNNLGWILLTTLIYALTLTFWGISTFRDPGYLKKSDKIEFLTLVERFEPGWLCPKCHVIRTPRSRHCNICDKWVERFDHHCPWIDNCIGTRNHGAFLIFLIITYILLVILVLQLALNFSIMGEYNQEEVVSRYVPSILPDLIVKNQVVYKGVWTFIMIISAFFWLLMNILLFTQIVNFLSNQTMNERYGNKSKQEMKMNDGPSFMSDEGQAALLRNASIDSTLDPKNKTRWGNFINMMKGSTSKDQYELFIESMNRAGNYLFQSILNDKNFY